MAEYERTRVHADDEVDTDDSWDKNDSGEEGYSDETGGEECNRRKKEEKRVPSSGEPNR